MFYIKVEENYVIFEKILVFISLCVGIFLTRVVLDFLIAFNAIDIETTKNLVETIVIKIFRERRKLLLIFLKKIVLMSELLPLVISLTLLKDKKSKFEIFKEIL